uniref:Uncharacterized protein n=1 Tax=Timema cristinae TaxID=61476 RepID=A0A7R9CT03_TIMCR|nr:unnamed protein product [Timema cristinae]
MLTLENELILNQLVGVLRVFSSCVVNALGLYKVNKVHRLDMVIYMRWSYSGCSYTTQMIHSTLD